MTPGVPTGAIAGAAANRARDHVLERLRAAEATHSTRAVALEGLKGIESRMLGRFVDAGVVRDAGEHRYYLDEARLAAYQAKQREHARLALLVFLVIAIVGLVVLALALATR
jgi:hypothetical protein